jgi:acyl carrier protein
MPAEKYQVGHGADTADVATLLWILLGEPDDYDSNTAIRTLVELGIDSAGMLDLWAAVCEEFGEGSLQSEIDPSAVDPNMTVWAAATTMTGLLAGGDHDC